MQIVSESTDLQVLTALKSFDSVSQSRACDEFASWVVVIGVVVGNVIGDIVGAVVVIVYKYSVNLGGRCTLLGWRGGGQ